MPGFLTSTVDFCQRFAAKSAPAGDKLCVLAEGGARDEQSLAVSSATQRHRRSHR
jgi:hypothetical protein